MFADPQSIKQDGTTAVSFPRTSVGSGIGAFTSPDGQMTGTVRQTTSKARKRGEMRVTARKVSADPLNPAVNVEKSFSAYVVIDTPLVGFTNTEIKAGYQALADWATAQIDRLLNGEY